MKLKESNKIEFKKSTAELKRALEDLCAFANSGEGTVYFGIDDSGKVVGQNISGATMTRVSTTILSSIEPRVYPNIDIETIKDKTVLVVEVKNNPDETCKRPSGYPISSINTILSDTSFIAYFDNYENYSNEQYAFFRIKSCDSSSFDLLKLFFDKTKKKIIQSYIQTTNQLFLIYLRFH